jgi:hypothetical protein
MRTGFLTGTSIAWLDNNESSFKPRCKSSLTNCVQMFHSNMRNRSKEESRANLGTSDEQLANQPKSQNLFSFESNSCNSTKTNLVLWR